MFLEKTKSFLLSVISQNSRYLRLSTIPVRDYRFWIIQFLVLFINVSHTFMEQKNILIDGSETYLLSISVYLVPCVYAGIAFGLGPAVITTFWAMLLSVPELTEHDPETRLGVLIQFVIILIMSAIVGIRVERERSWVEQTKKSNARLARLNATASALAHASDIDGALKVTLRTKLDPDAQQIVWIRLLPAPNSKAITRIDSNDPAVPDSLSVIADGLTLAACLTAELQRYGPDDRSESIAVAPIVVKGAVIGALGTSYANKLITSDEIQVLEGISSQLSIALENISHLKSLEDAFANLSAANEERGTYIKLATDAQEEERKRLSRELHDDTMQSLVVTLTKLETANRSGQTAKGKYNLREAQEILSQTLINLRRYCRDLRPSIIDDLGLVEAIDWLVTDLKSRQNIKISMTTTGTPTRLKPRKELLVFRVIQEAMHNIEKHAAATAITIHLLFTRESLTIKVSDNGTGAVPSNLEGGNSDKFGLGLRGMDERTKLLRGSLVIESEPRIGTTVYLSIPISGPHS